MRNHHRARPTSPKRKSPPKKRGATVPKTKGASSRNCRGLGIIGALCGGWSRCWWVGLLTSPANTAPGRLAPGAHQPHVQGHPCCTDTPQQGGFLCLFAVSVAPAGASEEANRSPANPCQHSREREKKNQPGTVGFLNSGGAGGSQILTL